MRLFFQGCWAVVVGVCPLVGGCASSQALNTELDARDVEIRELRKEKRHLSTENARLLHENDSLTGSLQRALTAQEIADEGYDDLTQEGISVGRRGDSVVVFTVPSAVTFGSGQAQLNADGRRALSKLGLRLLESFDGSARIFVEGHTDSDPIRRSSFASNRALSVSRASAVVDFLITEGKVPAGRLVVVGYGEYSPVAPNDSAANKALNRRVEVIVRK